MHETLVQFNFFGHFQLEVTGWKIVGYAGVLLFGARWLVQAMVSHVNKRPMLPRTFWYMSLAGALLSLSYFVFGKNDSVGILGFLFPSFVAVYNLMLDSKHQKAVAAEKREEKEEEAKTKAEETSLENRGEKLISA